VRDIEEKACTSCKNQFRRPGKNTPDMFRGRKKREKLGSSKTGGGGGGGGGSLETQDLCTHSARRCTLLPPKLVTVVKGKPGLSRHKYEDC